MTKKISSLAATTGIIAAALITAALVFSYGLARADSTTTDFEAFTLGTVNGQDGWIMTGPYDVAIDSSNGTAGFGAKSFRISDATTSGSFGDWAFSKSLTDEAGEIAAQNGGLSGGSRQTHFEAQFDVASFVPGAQQPGLHMSISPDRGDGARMSYLRFEDQADGIHVFFDDYQDNAPLATSINDAAGCGVGDVFNDTDIATLTRTPHTIKFVMDFVDGQKNDVVKIYIDGVLKHTGTSWEGYFNYCEGNPTRTVDSLIIQSRTGSGPAVTNPANAGKGFLIDNLSLLSGPTPPGSIVITKYVCPSNTVVTRAANGVGGAVPSGCVPDSGKTFGYVHGTQTDANAPYPELSTPLTAGGATDGSGVLTIANLPADGRYLVVETDGSNAQLPAGDILGLYCIGDGDTSGTNDNQELTFVPSDGTVNCVAYNKAPPTSTVTMCKVDNAQAPLQSWTLALKGASVEDLVVPTNTSTGINSVSSLASGVSYIATAVGTWQNQGGANPVDAEYSTTDGWTTHVDGYTGFQTDLLELQINSAFDPNSDWGAYNTAHTYMQSFVGSGSPANFRIFDGLGTTPQPSWYADNTGTLAVNISTGYASTTPANGCVTFTDVPYGTYTAGEIVQDGWTNDSGLGAVIVDSATEQFTVVNHENTPPPPPPPPANACATPLVAPAGYTLLNGTRGNDTVTLVPLTMFVGKGGNDKVTGPDGNYIVCLGNGNGTITLGNGDDTIKTGNGNAKITLGSGIAYITTGNGNATIIAGDGDKTVTTGSGNDKITTGSGADTINAGNGNNTVNAGAGNDSITTGPANDIIDGGADTDTCVAGGGLNTVSNCEL